MNTFLVFLAFSGYAIADGQRPSVRHGSAPASGQYGSPALSQYSGDSFGSASNQNEVRSGSGSGSEIDDLTNSIPGVPGEDYPILAEVPELSFTCDGRVAGGYYADTEAKCQVFHICTSDDKGSLSTVSFLCPNGTIFNQNYFICDWWFNFDCSEAEGLYSLNDKIAAEREELAGAASDAQSTYSATSVSQTAPGRQAAPVSQAAPVRQAAAPVRQAAPVSPVRQAAAPVRQAAPARQGSTASAGGRRAGANQGPTAQATYAQNRAGRSRQGKARFAPRFNSGF